MSKADIAAERKEQIVRATVECITKYGYHNFSMQDVARTASISKGIIHYYFLNKDDLMLSVLDRVATDIEKMLLDNMADISDPVEKLSAFVRLCMNVVRETREYYQVNMDFWTQINQKEDVRQIIAKHYQKFRECCADVIRAGVAANKFRNVEPNQYASLIIAVVDGLSLQWLFDDKIGDYDALVEQARRMVMDGLIAPS